MRVRLVKKFAEMIDGIDLTGHDVGHLLDVSPREARLLIAEQWAVRADERRRQYVSASDHVAAIGADRPRASKAKRILVVEDSEDVRALFGDALRLAGFHVTEAGDGLQALQHLHNHQPDLVVLDLRLPLLNGVDVHESIRSRKIPIVVVSGSPQDLGHLPVDCVLTKPVMPDTLVETVQRCLAAKMAALPSSSW